MTLPPLPLGAGARCGLRLARATVLALVVAVAATRVAAAQVADPYTATVTVDATSDTVAKARDLARADGQRRALTAIVERLAGGPGKVRLLKLGDNAITDMVTSFEVANEKMSAVRYVADYTYHFRQADVDKAMQAAGMSVVVPQSDSGSAAGTGTEAKPVVVLPVYEGGGQAVLWEDPNPWRDAWTERAAAAGGPRLLVPLGDVGDVGIVDAERARSGDAAALKVIAGKYGADEVIVLLAVARGADAKAGVEVTARLYRLGQFVDVHSDSIDAGEPLYKRAVDTVAADIATGWKNAKPPGGGQQGSLIAVATIDGLDDWIRLRDRLVTVPAVRKIELKALSRQDATLEIEYVGDQDYLKAGLADIGLDLIRGEPAWQLTRTGTPRP